MHLETSVLYKLGPLPENQNTKSFKDQHVIILGPDNTVKTILNCSKLLYLSIVFVIDTVITETYQ